MIYRFRRNAGDDDNVTVISSSWCKTRVGIVLSFAVPIEVMDIDEINKFAELFVDAVKESYGSLIKKEFVAKTEKPMICATHEGEIIMIWSFVGDSNTQTVLSLRNAGIIEMKYE